MIQFALQQWHPAKVLSITKYKENHGDKVVQCMAIKWRIKFPNVRLDGWYGVGMRMSFYEPTGTQTLEGIPETTPNLRCDRLEPPHTIKGDYPGYLMKARRGLGKSNMHEIEHAGSEMGKCHITPEPGGTCVMEYITKHSGLDPEAMGRIGSMDGCEVETMMIPPALQEGTLPDSHTTGKKQKAAAAAAPAAEGVNPFKHSVVDGKIVDNNPADGQGSADVDPKPEKDAGDIFSETHGKPAADVPPLPEGRVARAVRKAAVKPKKKIAGRGPK